MAAGPVDNAQLEHRDDIVVFTSGPLTQPLDIVGVPQAEICVSSDNPHADLFVRLCDVNEDGVSITFADAIQRPDPGVKSGQQQMLRLELDPCGHRILTGHRLRLQISGGAHPRFARNLGTAELLVSATTMRTSTPPHSPQRNKDHATDRRLTSACPPQSAPGLGERRLLFGGAVAFGCGQLAGQVPFGEPGCGDRAEQLQ
jgi:putative CocE/NonD family hydrolase